MSSIGRARQTGRQPTTRTGRLISENAKRGVTCHLFARATKGKSQAERRAPFIYLWPGDSFRGRGVEPISVTWKLRTRCRTPSKRQLSTKNANQGRRSSKSAGLTKLKERQWVQDLYCFCHSDFGEVTFSMLASLVFRVLALEKLILPFWLAGDRCSAHSAAPRALKGGGGVSLEGTTRLPVPADCPLAIVQAMHPIHVLIPAIVTSPS